MKRILITILLMIVGNSTLLLRAQTQEKIEQDLLALPEMKGLGLICVSVPEFNEPFFTYKGVEHHDDNISTIYWFHVYTQPQYEIRYYDIITDSDISLNEWRRQNKGRSSDVENLQKGDMVNGSQPNNGLFSDYDNQDLGISAKVNDGKVCLNFDFEKLEKNFGIKPKLSHPSSSNQRFEVKLFTGECTGLFVGDIGQNIFPVLCMLTTSGNVEILALFETLSGPLDEFSLMSSGPLPQMKNIQIFECGGGGAYEEDGETYYSYRTIYAIDQDNQRHEIQLFIPGGCAKHTSSQDYTTSQITLTADWKIRFTQKQGEQHFYPMYGWFHDRGHDDNYSIFQIEYNMKTQTPEGTHATGISGSFELDTNEIQNWVITPYDSYLLPAGQHHAFRKIDQ